MTYPKRGALPPGGPARTASFFELQTTVAENSQQSAQTQAHKSLQFIKIQIETEEKPCPKSLAACYDCPAAGFRRLSLGRHRPLACFSFAMIL
jgi:hypothetical protein